MEDGRPLFVQIAEQIESSILDGSLGEGERAPSTNELSAFHQINPATAAKGINTLVDRGILVKRRGLGMFVAEGARQALRDERRQHFADRFVGPLLTEAAALGVTAEEIVDMIRANRQAAVTEPHTAKDTTR